MGFFSKVSKTEDLTPLLSKVKLEIRSFLVVNNISRGDLEITSISMEPKEEGQYRVTISLCNLGSLIGKGGVTVKKLSTYLSNSLEKKVFIDAVESDLWK